MAILDHRPLHHLSPTLLLPCSPISLLLASLERCCGVLAAFHVLVDSSLLGLHGHRQAPERDAPATLKQQLTACITFSNFFDATLYISVVLYILAVPCRIFISIDSQSSCLVEFSFLALAPLA